MDRRSFVCASAVLAASSLAPPIARASAPKKVLVLGGTNYFGPVIVQALIDRGHDVTLFNRGITNPQLFPDLRKLRGDREVEHGRGLAELENAQDDWDWVVDTWQKSPKCVLDSARVLADKTRQYQYVSSVSVYDDWDEIDITEEAALNPVPDMPKLVATEFRYGVRKVLAEIAVERFMGNRAVYLRSHGMRGFAKSRPQSAEPYWPVRIARGGQVVVPEDATWTQMTDTVSMVRFMILCGEERLTGAFNVAYPPMQFKDYIGTIMAVTNSDARLHWLPAEFLAQHDVLPYRDLPMWRDRPLGAYRFRVQKAVDHGLINRPHSELVKDQLRGNLHRNPQDDYVFGQADTGTISAEKERELLEAWAD